MRLFKNVGYMLILLLLFSIVNPKPTLSCEQFYRITSNPYKQAECYDTFGSLINIIQWLNKQRALALLKISPYKSVTALLILKCDSIKPFNSYVLIYRGSYSYLTVGNYKNIVPVFVVKDEEGYTSCNESDYSRQHSFIVCKRSGDCQGFDILKPNKKGIKVTEYLKQGKISYEIKYNNIALILEKSKRGCKFIYKSKNVKKSYAEDVLYQFCK